MSDGSPWRPVVHVKDVSNAFIAGLEAPVEIIANQSYNVGIPDGNFTVKELAKAAQSVVSGSALRGAQTASGTLAAPQAVAISANSGSVR